MPAFAKISAVSTSFHASDLGFAQFWSQAAPGFGGWRIAIAGPASPTRVQVSPPGSQLPVFVVQRETREVSLAWLAADGAPGEEIGKFANLRLALLMLCPLEGDLLEEIHVKMERDFPRSTRQGHREAPKQEDLHK